MTLSKTTAMVAEFHRKFRCAIGEQLQRMDVEHERDVMFRVRRNMERTAEWRRSKNLGLQRVGLMMEEASEACEAIIECDMVALADGLADLVYVAVGTAVAYGIPLGEVLEEVHAANMRKANEGPGMKGAGWVPPDVAGILRKHGLIPTPPADAAAQPKEAQS